MTGFKLYKKQVNTLPFADYGLLLAECERVKAKSVLEFGPGYSTFAFIEAGVEKIVACEHDPKWLEVAHERFKDYKQVEIIRYHNSPVAAADELRGEFDLAFVDSPKGYVPARIAHPGQEDCSRLNTCILALKHAPVVLLHDATRPLERGSLDRLNAMGHLVTFIQGSVLGLARIERNGKKSARPDL